MSVPHLDTRVVDGEASLLFGPYAGFTTKFLKHGSYLDLFASIRWHNLVPMLAVGLSNLDLVKYLVGELLGEPVDEVRARCGSSCPTAKPEDWERITAGQRVQVIKKDKKKGGVLQFGTEVVTVGRRLDRRPARRIARRFDGRADHARPARACFPDRIDAWQPQAQRRWFRLRA